MRKVQHGQTPSTSERSTIPRNLSGYGERFFTDRGTINQSAHEDSSFELHESAWQNYARS